MNDLVKVKFLKDFRKFAAGDVVLIAKSSCCHLPDSCFEYVKKSKVDKKKTSKSDKEPKE